MKDSMLNPEFVKNELDDLKYLSSFIMYDKFGYNKKKLKKKFKKMRHKLKKGMFSECLDDKDCDIWWE